MVCSMVVGGDAYNVECEKAKSEMATIKCKRRNERRISNISSAPKGLHATGEYLECAARPKVGTLKCM